MINILLQGSRQLLHQLAWSRVLLAFDFDGTLAPITAERDGARMRSRTSELFFRLSELYPSAVISGRSQADVSARLGNAPVKHVVGNHGLEPGGHLDDFEKEISATKPLLESLLGHWPGVDIEDKRYSLAIHYRRARQKRVVRAAIHEAVLSLPIPMRMVRGKLVVNVIPARAPNKADALIHLRDLEGADLALYVGDDVTDEDVFELDQPGRLVTVRVGESRSSAASYFLKSQSEVDRLLAKLVAYRETPGTS